MEPWNAAERLGSAASRSARAPILLIQGRAGARGPGLGRGSRWSPTTKGCSFPPRQRDFRVTVEVFFYTEFYYPRLWKPAPPPIDPSVTDRCCILLPATGKPQGCSDVVASGGAGGAANPVVPFATRLPITNLPAGSYRLEVRGVVPSSPVMATRVADFDVE